MIEQNSESQKKVLDKSLGFEIIFSDKVKKYENPTLKTIRNAIFHGNIWREENKITFKDKRPNEKEYHTVLKHDDFDLLLPKLIKFILG